MLDFWLHKNPVYVNIKIFNHYIFLLVFISLINNAEDKAIFPAIFPLFVNCFSRYFLAICSLFFEEFFSYLSIVFRAIFQLFVHCFLSYFSAICPLFFELFSRYLSIVFELFSRYLSIVFRAIFQLYMSIVFWAIFPLYSRKKKLLESNEIWPPLDLMNIDVANQ